ncbi:MAG TPA: sigma-54 dependent transcriptional regulator, partial [Thermoanaerobaculia bacterium]
MNERVLIVDDEAGIRTTLSGILEDEGYRVTLAATAAEAREAVLQEPCDLVLLDLALPDQNGLELLEAWQRERSEAPVIAISGHGDVDVAVKATRLGAYDFLEKPLSLSRVVLTVQNALEKARMTRRIEFLSDQLERDHVLVGESPSMRRLKAELQRAAAADSRILIHGENGTGKELVARQVHLLSQRAAAAFVEVNCAAIPDELIESELFGHVKGAFTGASSDRAGRFEQADGGTIFLDEVADMSLKTQAKVLRVLQEQRFERVGSTASIQVDVRVLAATNKDLLEEIRQGRFRDDLYFRLAVIPLRVPPLRERREDVPPLAARFLEELRGTTGRSVDRISPDALRVLMDHRWPGNVRELRNAVEHAMVKCRGTTMMVEDLPRELIEESAGVTRIAKAKGGDARAMERERVRVALEEAGWNRTRAAERLGIDRST